MVRTRALLVLAGLRRSPGKRRRCTPDPSRGTKTPIQHVVVIFQENVSFDHYFGTYPKAANTDGQPFTAARARRPWTACCRHGARCRRPAAHADLTRRTRTRAPQRLDSTRPACRRRRRPADVRPGSQLQRRAAGVRRREDGPVRRRASAAATATSPHRRRRATPKTVMDYYDGNTVTGALELRAALRDERQLVRHDVRPVVARRDQPRLRATPATSTRRTRRTARRSRRSTRRTPTSRPDGTGGFSLTSDAQPYWDDCSTRDAVALTRQEHRRRAERRRPLVGLVPGRLPADRRRTRPPLAANGHAGQPTATFIPDQFKAPASTSQVAALVEPGHLRRGAPGRRRVRRGTGSTATRTTTSRTTSRSSTTPRRRTRTTSGADRGRVDTLPGCRRSGPTRSRYVERRRRSSTRRTTTTTRATSTSSSRRSPAGSCRRPRCRPSASSRRRATRTATPPTPTPPTSRRSSST